MLFSSHLFILAFLPFTVLGYYLANRIGSRIGMLFLFIASCVFYGFSNKLFLLLFLVSILFNYFCAVNICKGKPYLALGITWNILLIFVFKYFDFFSSSISHVFHITPCLLNVALPLGISFYTFQQISFILDIYKKPTEKISLLEYAVFVSFFPQLVAGPIVKWSEIEPQLKDETRKAVDYENLYLGIVRFVFGLSKKVLLADAFGRVVDAGLNTPQASSLDYVVVMLSYTLQIYLDFSGYSDMAIGIARMLNIELPENFAQPYIATSIEGFWRRWHLTLTRFLREYVYFPLGGSRKGKLRQICNIMIVFLISGLWHGANWTFILWGGIHGIFNIADRYIANVTNKVYVAIRWILSFVTVNILWLLFRCNSIKQWFDVMRIMVTDCKFTLSIHVNDTMFLVLDHLANIMGMPGQSSYLFFGVFVVVYIAILLVILVRFDILKWLMRTDTLKGGFATAILMVLSLLFISQGTEFIYFNF